ncbi:hypothetical protein Daesc_001122 [Daldinia eschscholtzii]|uniref:Uncharacterized protein n=1 Tax=Daldinia eschscholtzii TaxID=292717 RepID=A0AAX6N0Q1_9PEZI
MDQTENKSIRLPMEIIFQIMSALLPANEKAHLPPWHEAGKLLLAFSRVSHATHDEAIRKLKERCLYASVSRNCRFVLSLKAYQRSNLPLPSIFTNIRRMYICFMGNGSLGRTLELFDHIGPSLRSLTLDYFSPVIELDPNEQPEWRRCFKKLTQLEELACTIEILMMASDPNNRDKGEPLWPNLKRLGIIICYMAFDISWLFAQSPQLNHIVLRKTVRPNLAIQILPPRDDPSHQLPKTPVTVAISEHEDQSIQDKYVEDDRLRVLKYALPGKQWSSEIWWRAVLGGMLWDLGLPGSWTEARTEDTAKQS